MNPPPLPPPPEPATISLDDLWEIIQARWKHLDSRQRWVAIAGSAFILTGAGLALADIFTAGILFSLIFDFGLIAIGLGGFLWIAFQLKILTKGHVEHTRSSAARAAIAAVQAIAPPPAPAPLSSALPPTLPSVLPAKSPGPKKESPKESPKRDNS
jgi:hypothetical protein